MSRKKILLSGFIILILAVFLISVNQFYFLVKSRQILLNTFFIAEDDLIGVDISSYQGDVDMSKLKEQDIRFIYIKATEGSNHVDRRFAENWKNARENNLPAGAYHFFSYDSSGKKQAENFIKTVGELEDCLIPVVDVEYYADKEENPPEKEDLIRELQAYLDALEAGYDVKPMIYTRMDLYRKYLKGTFDDYKKWMSSFYYPLKWGYKDDWYIWQYLDQGQLDGLSGGIPYIDLNVLNKEKNLRSLMIPKVYHLDSGRSG